jgi:hypothetical protein
MFTGGHSIVTSYDMNVMSELTSFCLCKFSDSTVK